MRMAMTMTDTTTYAIHDRGWYVDLDIDGLSVLIRTVAQADAFVEAAADARDMLVAMIDRRVEDAIRVLDDRLADGLPVPPDLPVVSPDLPVVSPDLRDTAAATIEQHVRAGISDHTLNAEIDQVINTARFAAIARAADRA